MTQSVLATYENGSLRLMRKLPLRNHAKVRVIFEWPTSTAKRTQGLLRVSPRIVRLVAESVEPTTRRQRLDALLKRIRRQAAQHPISDQELKQVCDEVRQELYDARPPRRH